MYQIDVPSAAAALPDSTVAGAAGYFTDGDPTRGQQATVLPAEFLNSLMMELLNLLKTGGVAPDKGTFTQLRDALPKLGSNENGSYAIFPGGLAVMWGTGTQPDASGKTPVSFPASFAAPPTAFVTNISDGQTVAAFHGCANGTTQKMDVFSVKSTGVAAGAGVSFTWVALGRVAVA